jgi:hypothetical protein
MLFVVLLETPNMSMKRQTDEEEEEEQRAVTPRRFLENLIACFPMQDLNDGVSEARSFEWMQSG